MTIILGKTSVQDLHGPLTDFMQKLQSSNGEEWFIAFKKFLRKENPWVVIDTPQESVLAAKETVMVKEVNLFLRLLPGAEALPLSVCDGTRTIAQAKNVFRSYLDSDFTNWGLDVAGVATPTTCVQVHEHIKDGNFRQVFTSLSSDLDKVAMKSQDQIVTFCQEHPEWLQQGGYATLFLFKKGEEFFVALVRVDSGVLSVRVVRFVPDHVWRAVARARLACPQLAPENLSV